MVASLLSKVRYLKIIFHYNPSLDDKEPSVYPWLANARGAARAHVEGQAVPCLAGLI